MKYFTSIIILILIAVITHCLLSLIASVKKKSSSVTNISQYSLSRVIEIILLDTLKFYEFFVGKKWNDYNTLVRLALLYYVMLPNSALLRTSFAIQEDAWLMVNPSIQLLGLNVWIISNIIADYFSYNFSRNLIYNYLSTQKPTFIFTLSIIVKDILIAGTLLALLFIITNSCHLIYMVQDVNEFLGKYNAYVFNWESITVNFGFIKDGKPFIEFPGFIVITFSTFFPTLFWACSLLISLLFLPIKFWFKNVETEKRQENNIHSYRYKYLALLVTSLFALWKIISS